MNELIQTGRDALALRDGVFTRVRDSGDAFARGLAVLLFVALIVGLVTATAGFVGQVTAGTPQQQVERGRQSIEPALQMARRFSPSDPQTDEFWRIFQENLDAGFRMGGDIARVAQATTPLPGPIGDLFHALAHFVSFPWGRIGAWMLYSILVLLVARLLGGTATVQQMLGTTALYSAPHVLDALSFIPCIGFLLGVVAFCWGLVIYIKGTAVANRITAERAAVAVLAPAAVLFVLALISLAAAIILISGLAGAAGR